MYITASGLRTNIRPDGFYIKGNDPANWSLQNSEAKFWSSTYRLTDYVAEKYFGDISRYISFIGSVNPRILHAGLSPESPLSKSDFQDLLRNVSENDKENLFKMMYVEDLRDVINFLQNKVFDIKYSTIEFYRSFSHVLAKEPIYKDGIFFTPNPAHTLPFTLIESIFKAMHSTLDLCIKLCAFLDFTPPDYAKYHKSQGAKLIWGDRRKVSDIFKLKALDDCEHLRLIESLRNEFTHNGSWEACRRIYYKVENLQVTDQWIFFHDHKDGIPTKFGNRTRFYSTEGENGRINQLLPIIAEDFMLALGLFLEHVASTVAR